jgi:DNA polymerase V
MKATKPSLEKVETLDSIPFYSQAVAAGFPSPADDFLEFDLSLDKKLIKHPSATFFVRVSGTSMINAKILMVAYS